MRLNDLRHRDIAASMIDLVIGSAGCLGAAVSTALVAAGRTVRVLDLVPTDVPGVEEWIGDMGDVALMKRALEGVSTVHQCASVLSLNPGKRAFLWDTNVDRNRRVLEVSRDSGVRAFVYASNHLLCANVGEVIRGIDESVPYAHRPLSEYVASRIASERDVLAANDDAAGFRTIALRVPTTYGPRDRFHLNLQLELADRGVGVRAGKQLHCSHVFSENAAHAHVLAGDALRAGELGGRAYYLSDETPPPSYWDLMSELLVASGRRPPRGTVPRPLVAVLSHASETVYRRFGATIAREPVFSFEALTVAASDCWFSTDAIRRDLGWKAPIARTEAVARTAAWFASNPRPRPLVS